MVFMSACDPQKIVNLYPGTAADAAQQAVRCIRPQLTYSDGTTDEVYGFDIPVTVNADFSLAISAPKGHLV